MLLFDRPNSIVVGSTFHISSLSALHLRDMLFGLSH